MHILKIFAFLVISFQSITAWSAEGFVAIDKLIVDGQAVDNVAQVKLVQANGSANELTLKTGDHLNQGTELIVPSRTVITLKSSNGNVFTLQPSSRFKVQHVGDDGESHSLEAGTGDFSISKALNFFNVNYKHYTAMVRGTHYQISVEPDKEFRVSVDEGKVLAQRDVMVFIKGAATESPQEVKLQPVEVLMPGQATTYRLDQEGYFKIFGNYGEAENYYRQQLAADEASGDGDRIIGGLYALGRILIQISKFEDAKSTFDRMLKIQKSIPKPNLRWDGLGLVGLGYAYSGLGDQRKAIETTEKALAIQQKLFANGMHPDVAMSFNNLGFFNFKQGDKRKASDYVEKALAIERTFYPDELHSDMASGYINLAACYNANGDSSKAIEFVKKALAIEFKLYPDGVHPNIASAYNNLATYYHAVVDSTIDTEYLEKAIAIQKKLYPDGLHADLATSYHNLGVVSYRHGDYRKAIENLEKARAIRSKLFGDDSATLAETYLFLGKAYSDAGDKKTGAEYVNKSLKLKMKQWFN